MACYFTFFLSEFYFEVSGIISIVTLGVLMGTFGRVNINSDSEKSLHSVYQFIQFLLETTLFVLTGAFIGYEFFN